MFYGNHYSHLSLLSAAFSLAKVQRTHKADDTERDESTGSDISGIILRKCFSASVTIKLSLYTVSIVITQPEVSLVKWKAASQLFTFFQENISLLLTSYNLGTTLIPGDNHRVERRVLWGPTWTFWSHTGASGAGRPCYRPPGRSADAWRGES